MHNAVRRPVKLWLPNAETLKQSEGESATKSDANVPEDEEDDLDKLLQQYEAEAAADRREVQGIAKEKTATQMGMAELRETGMAKPISSDSRGFQLLAKMGYKEGEGIGKSVKGRAAPIDVSLKSGRTGLGIDEERKRKKEDAKSQQTYRVAKRQHRHEELKSSYISGRATSFAERQVERRLAEARKVCETLDRRKGMTENVMWLPPPPPPPEDEQQVQDAQESGAEALDADAWENLPAATRLTDVLQWLRSEYFYCVFCGCQFTDTVELESQCPGVDEDAH